MKLLFLSLVIILVIENLVLHLCLDYPRRQVAVFSVSYGRFSFSYSTCYREEVVLYYVQLPGHWRLFPLDI